MGHFPNLGLLSTTTANFVYSMDDPGLFFPETDQSKS
jgi:hypothetical protein